MLITKELLEKVIPGKWVVEPDNDWKANNVVLYGYQLFGKDNLYFAMSPESFLNGSKNTGVYAKNIKDQHDAVIDHADNIKGAIVERKLDVDVPQYLVEDGYKALEMLAEYASKQFDGKSVAITGTVGKSSTKNLLVNMLDVTFANNNESSNPEFINTISNDNSRTKIRQFVANYLREPKYAVAEVAVSSLWMKTGSITKLMKPYVSVVTQVGIGQKGYDEHKMAEFKTRVAQGLQDDGYLLINSSIDNIDEVLEYAQRFTNNILLYGFRDNDDFKMKIKNHDINGIEAEFVSSKFNINYTFTTNSRDRGTLENIAAAISSYVVLLKNDSSMDLEKIRSVLNNMPSKSRVLEPIDLNINNNKALLIDDSYNAEKLSMENAFDFSNAIMQRYKGKKIAVIGKIVNLEQRSAEVHKSLAPSLIKAGFDKVICFTNETKPLYEALPEEMRAGIYDNPLSVAQAISKEMNDDSFILLKGSTRETSIEKIRKYLTADKESLSKFIYNYGGVISNLNGDIVSKYGNSEIKSIFGVGNFIAIAQATKKLAHLQLNLNETFSLVEQVKHSSNDKRAIGMNPGEKYSFNTILKSASYYDAPDAEVALSHIVAPGGPTNQFKRIAKNLNLTDNSVENVTGRINKKNQEHNLFDLIKIASEIGQLPKFQISQLLPQSMEINNEMRFPSLRVQITGKVIGVIHARNSVMFWFEHNNEVFCGSIIAKNATNYDFDSHIINSIDKFILNKKNDFEIITKKMNSSLINVIGDVYFGEFYSRKRISKGQNDGLQKFGYGHSFRKINKFFHTNDYNIANLEAVLVDENKEKRFSSLIDFPLDAGPQETLEELKKNNFNALTTATNHALDFGESGEKETLDWINKYGFEVLGSGMNVSEAYKHLKLKSKNKNIHIFNGYRYNMSRFDMKFYADGDNAGVAMLGQVLLDEVRKVRFNDPDSKIILIAHWGKDFKEIVTSQKVFGKQFIDAGGSLIIGHGPHMVQAMKTINSKPIVYSIGNGVFNSNGEYKEKNMPPYGYLTKIDVSENKVRLYPILTDNLVMNINGGI